MIVTRDKEIAESSQLRDLSAFCLYMMDKLRFSFLGRTRQANKIPLYLCHINNTDNSLHNFIQYLLNSIKTIDVLLLICIEASHSNLSFKNGSPIL